MGFREILSIIEVPFQDIPVNIKVDMHGIQGNTLVFKEIVGNTGEGGDIPGNLRIHSKLG